MDARFDQDTENPEKIAFYETLKYKARIVR